MILVSINVFHCVENLKLCQDYGWRTSSLCIWFNSVTITIGTLKKLFSMAYGAVDDSKRWRCPYRLHTFHYVYFNIRKCVFCTYLNLLHTNDLQRLLAYLIDSVPVYEKNENVPNILCREFSSILRSTIFMRLCLVYLFGVYIKKSSFFIFFSFQVSVRSN